MIISKRLLGVLTSALIVMILASNSAAPALGQAATPAATMSAATMSAAPVNAGGSVTAVYTLPDLPLAAAQNAILKDSIKNDRKMNVGGLGSDMWHGPKDAADEFWVISDRGPNGQIKVDDKNRRTFPVPEFTPTIYKVKVAGTAIQIVEALPILTATGKAVTGLPNLDVYDEVPYDYTAQTKLDYNQNGLDSEGIVRLASGDFWVADEYSPSILKIDKTGKVVKRYVPTGIKLDKADYPVVEAFPAVFGKRKVNRGFEALALSADEKTLYVGLQSPLSNPDSKVANPSRNTRILAFDIATEKVVAQYVYQFDEAKAFGGEKNAPEEMKVSALVAIGPNTLIVEERTDLVAKLYTVDLTKATNILGTAWDDLKTAPTLEGTADLAGAKIEALPKTLVIDLSLLKEVPGKIEGVSVLDKSTVVVVNDNDYDIGTFDADGNNKGAGTKIKIVVIKLDKPLP